MWGRNKETCCDYSDQNIQQVHYKFDFRIRTWYIINLHAATGEKEFYRVKDEVAAAGGFSPVMKLRPDFSVCM